jgi:tyrosinase
MHHGFVDEMWTDWQAKDPKRLKDISGPNAQEPKVGFLEFSGGIEEESKIWGHPTATMKAMTPDPTNGDKRDNQTILGHVLTPSSF